jgi:hypothetical protein
MSEAEDIAALIKEGLPRIGGGTLRFWGEWFGRPYDNCHRLVECEAENDLLKLRFNENEMLFVWAPRRAAFERRPYVLESGASMPSGGTLVEQVFRIDEADRVRWEWFYYGRPQVLQNRYFIQYARTRAGMESANNIDWCKCVMQPDSTQPAVELISLESQQRHG